MQIQLSEHFTYKKLLRFVLPSIVMMIFTSIYGVVDGLFVSNYVGKTAFAAVNLIMPFLMAISALGFMIGTGGSAIVAKTLGEGKKKQANEYFSMLVYLTLIGGIVPLRARHPLFPADCTRAWCRRCAVDKLCALCPHYAALHAGLYAPERIPEFLVTAEKPKLGACVIVIAGVTNMVLDFLLVAFSRSVWPVRHLQRSPVNASVVCFRSFILHAKIPAFLSSDAHTLTEKFFCAPAETVRPN